MPATKRFLLEFLVAALVGAMVGVLFGGIELGYRYDASALVGGGLAVALVIYGPAKIAAKIGAVYPG